MNIELNNYKQKVLRTDLAISCQVSALANCFLVCLYVSALVSIDSNLNYTIGVGAFLFFSQVVRFFHGLNKKLTDTAWLDMFTLIVIINSLSWFVLISSVLIKNIEKSQITILSFTIVAGLVASGAYSISISRRDFFIFQGCLLSTVLIGFNLAQNDMVYRLCGTLITVLFFAYLIIQRKNHEEAWLEKIMHTYDLQKIIDTIPGGISILRNGTYIRMNEHLKKYILQKSDSLNLIGAKLGEFNSPENEFINKISAFSKSKEQLIQFETQIEVNQEKRFHLVVAQNIFKFNYTDTVIVTIDIQDFKNSELENKMNISKLEQSSKMASLGEMSSGLAHEINNPLVIILGRTQLLLREVQANNINYDLVRMSLESIEKTTFRIAKIVKGLKTFAREAENDEFARTRIKDIIDDTLSFCESRFKHSGVSLHYNLNQTEHVLVECRPTQLSQVILNALNNSYDAILNLEKKWIELSVEKSESTLMIKITDSGSGIDKNIQQKLMQPFFTTKEVGKGTGLGLSLSKGIIESHHGKMYFNFDHPTNTQLIIELLENQPLKNVA